jgi:uncharacterized membrane protein (UPF0182 family)
MKSKVRYQNVILKYLQLFVVSLVTPFGRLFSVFHIFPYRLKGVQQILPAVITLSVVGITLVMLTYMTKTFQTSLGTSDSTIDNIFNTLFGFYGLVASFLSPIGVVILMTVILALVIGLVYYFRGVSGGTA